MCKAMSRIGMAWQGVNVTYIFFLNSYAFNGTKKGGIKYNEGM